MACNWLTPRLVREFAQTIANTIDSRIDAIRSPPTPEVVLARAMEHVHYYRELFLAARPASVIGQVCGGGADSMPQIRRIVDSVNELAFFAALERLSALSRPLIVSENGPREQIVIDFVGLNAQIPELGTIRGKLVRQLIGDAPATVRLLVTNAEERFRRDVEDARDGFGSGEDILLFEEIERTLRDFSVENDLPQGPELLSEMLQEIEPCFVRAFLLKLRLTIDLIPQMADVYPAIGENRYSRMVDVIRKLMEWFALFPNLCLTSTGCIE
jgi:hypothetical protein